MFTHHHVESVLQLFGIHDEFEFQIIPVAGKHDSVLFQLHHEDRCISGVVKQFWFPDRWVCVIDGLLGQKKNRFDIMDNGKIAYYSGRNNNSTNLTGGAVKVYGYHIGLDMVNPMPIERIMPLLRVNKLERSTALKTLITNGTIGISKWKELVDSLDGETIIDYNAQYYTEINAYRSDLIIENY